MVAALGIGLPAGEAANSAGSTQPSLASELNSRVLNLPALQRIVSAKYQRGPAFNRQHPFVEVLFSDITDSGETLDLSELVRVPLPPAFHRLA